MGFEVDDVARVAAPDDGVFGDWSRARGRWGRSGVSLKRGRGTCGIKIDLRCF